METPEGPEAPPPAGDRTVSPDFFQGGVEQGLKRMRTRLLDLSSRNRLLNFRHTKKSSLRVVDELPDTLFEALRSLDSLTFAPIPRPTPLKMEAAPREEGGGTSTLDDAGKRTAPAVPPVAQYAAELGIATSFDLPEPSGDGANNPRHVDRLIQTLHYPEDLEAILRSIASAARLAIEETGTNMLYLSFGFLEWYESDDSSQLRSAPLVLLPVSLERGDPDPATRTYPFSIQYSGEDIMANLSLQERLRQDFNIDLPDLTDEVAPEQYWKMLSPLLTQWPRWRLRRQITLCLLSFGKLLMYRDLLPENWPPEHSIRDHGRVNDLFNGVQTDGAAFASSEYDLDDPSLEPQVPNLVDDADSSQHSALIDALGGRNVVFAEAEAGLGCSPTQQPRRSMRTSRLDAPLWSRATVASTSLWRTRVDASTAPW
jgi:hypothetical protein